MHIEGNGKVTVDMSPPTSGGDGPSFFEFAWKGLLILLALRGIVWFLSW